MDKNILNELAELSEEHKNKRAKKQADKEETQEAPV